MDEDLRIHIQKAIVEGDNRLKQGGNPAKARESWQRALELAREAGFGGMGFTPSSQGGTHIVERNLTRLTVLVSVLFFTNTIVLYRLLA